LAKVLFGNWLSATRCNVYSAATIYCGHVGEAIDQYPDGTRAHSREEWHCMQVESSQNFDVPGGERSSWRRGARPSP